MPFQYSGYVNPYAGTIAQMLARRGEIGARSAENVGNINARATEQRGAAWAGAAQNIGQIAAGIPLQMQQQREQAEMNRYRSAITAKTEQDTQLTADANEAGKRAQAALAESLARHKRPDGSEDFAAVAVDVASFDPKMATEFQSLDKETKADRDAMRDRAKKYAAENAMTSARIAAQSKDLGNFIARVDMFVADGVMDEGNRNAVLKRAMAAGEDGWPTLQQEIIKGSPEFEAEQLKTKGAATDIAYKEAQTKALGEPKSPAVGTLEDFLLRTYGPAPTGKQIVAGKAIYEAAGRAPEKLGATMWAAPPGGGDPKLMTPEEIRASGAIQPPTAEMRNKVVGRELAAKSIKAVQDLSLKIITKVGPAQRADAIKRGAEAVFGTDPEFRTYQDARMALAGNLAVAQQGSRPSDADIKAIWLPLVPDPYRDTAESAAMKWELIRTMSSAPPSEGGAITDKDPLGIR